MNRFGLYEIAGLIERGLPQSLSRPLLMFSWRLAQNIKMLRGLVTSRPTGPYVQIGPVATCNYRCFFCHTHSHRMAEGEFSDKRNEKYYEHFYEDRNNLIMPIEMFQDLIEDLVKISVREIDLSGTGEPLLHPRIADMVRHASERNIHCNITTNGALLNRDLIDELLTAGLKSITISINSLDPITYRTTHGISNAAIFHQLLHTVSFLSEIKKAHVGFRLNASFAISRLNYAEIPDFVTFSKKHGFNATYFRPYIILRHAEEYVLSQEQAEETTRLLKRLTGSDHAFYKMWHQAHSNRMIDSPCLVGYLFCFINSNGDVLPCCGCKYVMGNLRKKSFAGIWNDAEYDCFRRNSLTFYKHRSAPGACDCMICPEPVLQSQRYGTIVKGIKKAVEYFD